MILLSEQSFLPFCKEGVVLEKKESVSKVLGLVTMYNQKLSQYVKDYRNYGTPQKLRSDQIHLICHIGRNPKCNLRYLAEATGACFPTVSLQVDRLRNIGLVTKTRSSANQREIEIALTEDGRRQLLPIIKSWMRTTLPKPPPVWKNTPRRNWLPSVSL